jgi:hypothetical protein
MQYATVVGATSMHQRTNSQIARRTAWQTRRSKSRQARRLGSSATPPVHRATQLVCTTHTLICVNSLPLHRDRMISRPIAVPGGQDAREWTAPASQPQPGPALGSARSLRPSLHHSCRKLQRRSSRISWRGGVGISMARPGNQNPQQGCYYRNTHSGLVIARQ